MKNKLFLFIIFAGVICAQELPKIQTADFKEIKITREDYFDGNSLWGYINGGADLFLEYGFEKLLVEEFTVEQQNIKLEVWQMKNPLSAFGIYSVSHSNKNQNKVQKLFPVCITDYQYQMVLNEYYISIINENGSVKAKSISAQVTEIMLNKIDVSDFELPFQFVSDFLDSNINSSKFMTGKLGVQRGIPDWIDVFEGEENFSILIISPDNTSLTTGIIKSPSKAVLKRFSNYYGFKNLEFVKKGIESNDDSSFYYLKQFDDSSFVFIENIDKDFQFNNYLNDVIRSE